MYNILIQLNSSNNTATVKVYGDFPKVLTLVMVRTPGDVLDVLNVLGYNLGELLASRGNRANYQSHS